MRIAYSQCLQEVGDQAGQNVVGDGEPQLADKGRATHAFKGTITQGKHVSCMDQQAFASRCRPYAFLPRSSNVTPVKASSLRNGSLNADCDRHSLGAHARQI